MLDEGKVGFYDRSHWGRLVITGGDRLRFLHNQSTNDFQKLQPGQGCDTVFVTATARTIDLVSAYVTETSVILLTSPERREKLLQWCDRYIFPRDDVQVADVTEATACLSLLGTDSDALLGQLGIPPLSSAPLGTHQEAIWGDRALRLAVGSGLGLPGYTLILPREEKTRLVETLAEKGAEKISDRHWEILRIQQGRPTPNYELTEDYNPLEAGLWQTISFEKGCYIGQETIARLNTYQGVKQQLWGIELSAPASPGTPIYLGEEKAGILTSCIATAQGIRGLAYIRTKIGGKGLTVQVGEASGIVVDIPFITRGYLSETSS